MALTQITLRSGPKFDAVYNLTDEQVDSIIHYASHHSAKFDNYIISFEPTEHDQIKHSITKWFPRDNSASLGLFTKLPREYWLEILLRCDIKTIFAFRQASLGIRNMIDSFHEFPAIAIHGSKLPCALLRTGLAARYTLAELYAALTTEKCTFCGGFAGYISILTWMRTCFNCIHFIWASQVVCQATAKRRLNLTVAQTRQLPSFKPLKGTYCIPNRKYEAPRRLVSVAHAAKLAGSRLQDASWSLASIHKKYNFMGTCPLPYYNRTTGIFEHGVSCTACVRLLEETLSRYPSRIIWGRDVCINVYSREEFLEHFQVCQRAQQLSSGILANM